MTAPKHPAAEHDTDQPPPMRPRYPSRSSEVETERVMPEPFEAVRMLPPAEQIPKILQLAANTFKLEQQNASAISRVEQRVVQVAADVKSVKEQLGVALGTGRAAQTSSADLEGRALKEFAQIASIKAETETQTKTLGDIQAELARRNAEEAALAKLRAEQDDARTKRRDFWFKVVVSAAPILAVVAGIVTALLAHK